jgi:hypothetical protein
MTSPIRFTWNGDAMVPHNVERMTYVIGQKYWLEEVSERSWASHSHQFAWLREAWLNLPEAIAPRFPSPEHLRKAALIATGWRNERIIETDSPKTARAVAAYAKSADAFAHVRISGNVVVVRTARSQRMRGEGAMSKHEFQESKDATLEWISTLIGVDPHDLRGAA